MRYAWLSYGLSAGYVAGPRLSRWGVSVMSRNTAECATVDSVARPVRPLGAVTSAPAQIVLDLVRPWRIVASQMLLMAEPFFSPQQRSSLQRHLRRLQGSFEPLTSSAPADCPVQIDGPDRAPGGRVL
jgi:hypothetical protein